MKHRRSRTLTLICRLLLVAATPACARGDAPPAAVSAFNSYIHALESRLALQHRSRIAFLAISAPAPQTEARLRHGDLLIEQLTPSTTQDFPGAMLHHWRGTAFVPAAHAADFERLMKDLPAYPQHFSPQVLRTTLLTQHNDTLQASMRVRQKHVITVVLDTTYDITFAQLDPQHGYSLSRSTRISEIASPNTPSEHPLSPHEEHGFLWRQNTYWTYEERDGGLYMQIESVSLTRSIPTGLAWAVRPYVESVPRESLEFTLRATTKALSH
jgi:hypothetical protein